MKKKVITQTKNLLMHKFHCLGNKNKGALIGEHFLQWKLKTLQVKAQKSHLI